MTGEKLALGQFEDNGGNTIAQESMLQIRPEQFRDIAERLDYDGSGVVNIPRVVDSLTLRQLQEEADSQIYWRNVDDVFVNQRGVRIEQHFDAFALKLLQGDQRFIDASPTIKAFIGNIEGLTRGLAFFYPTLEEWTADEVAFHRYHHGNEGLSMHKDNLRHPGLIATFSLSGVARFDYKTQDGGTSWVIVSSGDLVLTRASGLLGMDDLRPEHAVTEVYTPSRVSMTIRANTRPNEPIPRAEYDNWSKL